MPNTEVIPVTPGLGADRSPFEMMFSCDRPPEQGGPPTHKHTGATYVLKPPKSSLSLRWSMKLAGGEPGKVAQSIHRWMDRAFGPETAELLRMRMYGPDDDDVETIDEDGNIVGEDPDEDPLDVTDIMATIKYTSERVNGVPPTSETG